MIEYPMHERPVPDPEATAEAIEWLRTQTPPRPALTLLLMALATQVDENFECKISMRLLSEDVKQTPRAVQKQVKELMDLGYVTRERRFAMDGTALPSIYRLPVGDYWRWRLRSARTSSAK